MQTLKASLKEIVLQSEPYLLVEGGYCWRASELLRWLERNAPTDLTQPVQVVFPTLVSEGGIYLLDREGEVIGSLPLYWIEHSFPLLPNRMPLSHSVVDARFGMVGGDR